MEERARIPTARAVVDRAAVERETRRHTVTARAVSVMIAKNRTREELE